jgi:hypothetical protein
MMPKTKAKQKIRNKSKQFFSFKAKKCLFFLLLSKSKFVEAKQKTLCKKKQKMGWLFCLST